MIQLSDSGLQPNATQDDLLRLIRDLVSDHGIGIRRLAPRTVSLEEFYLQVGR